MKTAEAPNPPISMESPSGENLPNNLNVLVLGLLSILSSPFTGIPGILSALAGILFAVKARKIYAENPGNYSFQSYMNLKAGMICCFIGLIISSIFLYLFAAVWFAGPVIALR